MKTLHIAPGRSAGSSLRQALRDAGKDDDVLAFSDDLSCGPINSDAPSGRKAWWAGIYDLSEEVDAATAFWDRVAAADERLVVWFGRHSAMELSFIHAWAYRLGARPYQILDVTDQKVSWARPDGSHALRLARCASLTTPGELRTLFGQERPITPEERLAFSRRWQSLREENAPFRIVTDTGLASAPLDHFDFLILREATREWQRMARIIGQTMGHNDDPYYQVGDLMLQRRVVDLVAEGKLIAEGDPCDMRTCRIRRPD